MPYLFITGEFIQLFKLKPPKDKLLLGGFHIGIFWKLHFIPIAKMATGDQALLAYPSGPDPGLSFGTKIQFIRGCFTAQIPLPGNSYLLFLGNYR
jgi:hypothetical protein